MAWIVLFATAAFGQHVANPFVGATQYLNPDYSAEVSSAIATASTPTLASQMKAVASYPTAVWMDHIGAISGGTANHGRLGLAQHITTALSQQSGAEPVVITLVIYDLPGRDCAALASNGEISIAGNGTLTGIQQYEQDYITPIYNILASYATNPNLRFVLVIEPDSLPNLVTNTGMGAAPIANCVAANGGISGGPSLNGVYVQGIQYALNTFHPLTNVYQYLDIGQSAWLGWTSNLQPAIQLYNDLVKGTTAGYDSIDGFISNTSNYVPTKEPFMTANQQIGGNPVDSATFYQYDPEIDELDYDQAFYAAATNAGFPTTVGFLIDTSRNGWGGPLRPAAPSTANDVNTFVTQSKIDDRGVRGVWCNIQSSGIGAPPTANPGGFANLQAYVWIKPPGESDGTYPGSTYGGVTSTTGDPNCNPANTNALAGGPTDSLPNSPPAGTFWATEFAMNVENAYPAIPASVSSSFALSATAVSVEPGSTANSTVTITDMAGFSGAVNLTVSGLPTGVTAAFNPPSVSGGGGSTLTFTAANSAAGGTSNVTVTGTSGSTTAMATVVLTVESGSSSAPALSVSSPSLSATQGASVTDSIAVAGFSGNATLSVSGLPAGVTAAFNPSSVNGSGSSTLTLSAASTAATGTSTVTVTGTFGSATATATIALTVIMGTVSSPAIAASTPSLSLSQGASNTDNIMVTGFSGGATLSVSGLPNGVTAGFSTNPATSSSILQLTASSTAPAGAATITVSASSGSETASVAIALTVVTPSYSLASSPPSLTVAQGASATTTIAVTGVNGFSGSVALTAAVTTSPSGAVAPPTFSFNTGGPISVSGNAPVDATLTILTTASSSASCTASEQRPSDVPWRTEGGAILAGLLLFFTPKRSRAWRSMLSLLLLFIALAGGAVACSNSGGGGVACPANGTAGTSVGTYVITLTGTSGALTETGTVTLTVQ